MRRLAWSAWALFFYMWLSAGLDLSSRLVQLTLLTLFAVVRTCCLARQQGHSLRPFQPYEPVPLH